MKISIWIIAFLILEMSSQNLFARSVNKDGHLKSNTPKAVISDLQMLKEVGAQIVEQDVKLNVGVAYVTPEQEQQISLKAHEKGRCGGYEALPSNTMSVQSLNSKGILNSLRQLKIKNDLYKNKVSQLLLSPATLKKDPKIEAAIGELKQENLRSWVQWFSGHASRYHKGKSANEHVNELKFKIEDMIKEASFPITVSLIDHRSTPQRSIRVHIEGRLRPSEIVVMGGHMDSINQWAFGGKAKAPGADDNASGSSNLLETLRVLIKQGQPARSVEIMWYAGEEAGLLGSAEIAQDYRNQGKDVVGVLQLDMTLHPGAGEFVIGNMEDFTSSWLREYFLSLNNLYVGARVINDKCGYGCSDHASWHRQDYPALMPFESDKNGMNHEIHTARDVINSQSSFAHSLMFSKIAVAFAMDLGNSNYRQPY